MLPAHTALKLPVSTDGVDVTFVSASVRAVTDVPLQFTPFTLSVPVVKPAAN